MTGVTPVEYSQPKVVADVYGELTRLLRVCCETRAFMERQRIAYSETIREARAFLQESARLTDHCFGTASQGASKKAGQTG